MILPSDSDACDCTLVLKGKTDILSTLQNYGCHLSYCTSHTCYLSPDPTQ